MMHAPSASAILHRLPAHDVVALAPCLTPTVRRQMRNEFIRATIGNLYPNLSRKRAAEALEHDLTHGIQPGSRRADAAAAILALNDGGPIKARQILNVVTGVTGGAAPVSMQKLARYLHFS